MVEWLRVVLPDWGPLLSTESRRSRKSSTGPKSQRIRDPIHDLIQFDDETDRLVWRLLNCSEFQRLRRIKQLGFSEYVFPGATHTRLAHCIGVFHTARQLLRVIQNWPKKFDQDRARITLCASLLHDVGHGPFSHVFEGVGRALAGRKTLSARKKHEEWTSEIVLGDTEVNRVLTEYDKRLPAEISRVLLSEDPVDVYATIVSSQFDADRLDYLRRDRYMCGVSVGYFDYSWILRNLKISEVTQYSEGEEGIGKRVACLVLDGKAKDAAEGYLIARYQLYSTIYYHKTTRSAEKVLERFWWDWRRTCETASPMRWGSRRNTPWCGI
jgi:uncharacterized protein